MRKRVRVLVLVTVTMALAVGVPRIVEGISGMDLFRVAEIQVEGNRYLGADEVERIAAVPEGASVWDDPDPIADRLERHPGVRTAEVRRRLPGTLVLSIAERQPVALFPNPTLVPVDAEGVLLPFDPALHRVDLPLIQPRRTGSPDGVEDPAPLTPVQIRDLASELRRLDEVAPELVASISDVALDPWGDIVIRVSEPAATLRYGLPLPLPRLEEGLVVLADALDRNPGRTPIEVDLRFEDQVVVRLSPMTNR